KDDTPYPFVVQCEQHKIAKMGIARLADLPNAEYRFGSRAVAVSQTDSHVQLTIETAEGTKTVEGSYLIGADGGRSTIRKALEIPFDGYTWPERFLVLTTSFNFASERGVAFRCYFSDPDEWANLFKVAGDDGLGR